MTPDTASSFPPARRISITGGGFRIPLEDFGSFYDDFLETHHLDPETLQYIGPPPSTPALRAHAKIYPGNDRVFFPSGPHRIQTPRPADKMNPELSEASVSFLFVDRASRMQCSIILDSKTGNGLFGKGHFDD